MTDQELIDSVLKGNTACYKELVLKYQQQVFRLCMGFTHCREDAEDLCQEVFIRAFRSLSHFKKQSAFTTWLYRIAVNACLNFKRKLDHKKMMLTGGTLDAIDMTITTGRSEKAADEALFEKEIAENLHRAIALLPPKQRVAFILARYQKLPQKEIAVMLETTTGAVEQLLQRANEHLRCQLLGFYEENVKYSIKRL